MLEDFLSQHSRRAPMAFEFRHDSWRAESTYTLLRKHEVAWAVVETDKQAAVRETTAPFSYIRLRKDNYKAAELSDFAGWLKTLSGDVFVYLKHAGQAPAWAQQLSKFLT